MKKILLILFVVFVSVGIVSAQRPMAVAGMVIQSTSSAPTMNGTLLEDWYGGSTAGEDDSDQLATWADGIIHNSDNWNDSNTTTPVAGATEDLSLHETSDSDVNRLVALASSESSVCVAWVMELNELGDSEQCSPYLHYADDQAPNLSMAHVRWIYDGPGFNARLIYNAGAATSDSSPNAEFSGAGVARYFAICYVAGSGSNDAQVDFHFAATQPTASDDWTQGVDIEDGTATADVDYIGIWCDGLVSQIGEIIYTTDGTLPYWSE